jgi:glutathione S-transferase
MSMTTYKLTYFNGRGRAELSRLVFAAAGVQYQDVRLEMGQWAALKPTMPFGKVPTLEFDGITLCQSKAIARYLARKYDLAGKTELEQARADMLVDCMADAGAPILNPSIVLSSNEEQKAAIKKKYRDEQLPGFLSMLEKLLIANKGGDGFFVGDELTWADLGFLDLIGVLTMAEGDSQIADYPKLSGLRQRVENIPSIADWLHKRPVTHF